MVREVRLRQLELLKRIIGTPHEPAHRLPSALYIWGPQNSGKTYTIHKAIKIAGIKHVAEVTAPEILCGKAQFLQSILDQLRGSNQTPPKCVNLAEFLQEMTLFCREECTRHEDERSIQERVILVINQVHLLKEHSDLLHALERCQEITQHNICVIFTSTHGRTTLNHQLTAHMPIIRFPQYTHTEIVTIILRKLPGGPAEDFVSTIVMMHHETCRDLIKFWRLVNLHYPQFERLKATEVDFNVKEHCSRLTEVLRRDLRAIQTDEIPGPPPMIGTKEGLGVKSHLTMPISAKYVLISGYLASRNPVPPDSSLVLPGQGSRKRTHSSTSEHSNEVIRIREPKTFLHERLESIYRKLSGKTVLSDDFLSAITTLCKSKLLVRNIGGSLEESRYRCLADKRLISRISETIDFPLKLYLLSPF